MLRPHRRTVATPQNLNTEIGLPLTVLGAPADTEVLVLEMGMRGEGQIAELARIAEPDVGVIVSIGPVHLELLGTVERVAATKAELLAGLPDRRHGDRARRRAAARRRTCPTHVDGRDLRPGRRRRRPAARSSCRFDAAHLRRNAMARAGRRAGRRRRARRARSRSSCPTAGASAIELPGRGGRRGRLLQRQPDVDARRPRRAGPRSRDAASPCSATCSSWARTRSTFHREIGAYARERADLLVTVGPLAAHMGGDLRAPPTPQQAADRSCAS